MKKRNNKNIQVIQFYPEEKLAEFRHMSLRSRLQWLEEANAFVKKALLPSKKSAVQK